MNDLFSNRPKRLNKLPQNPERAVLGSPPLGRFPKWLHRKLPKGSTLLKTGELLKSQNLNTVCEEAKCPNRLECYSKKTATFLALGKACTRSCGFCDIDFAKDPLPPEKDEPQRIAKAALLLSLKHVVITMVARDDLPDQGASHIASILKAIQQADPNMTKEVLTSDFSGLNSSLDLLLETPFEIFNHNIETVRSLTPRVRHKATYERSLSVLSYVKSQKRTSFVKSGIMLGLGETESEVKATLEDLYQAGCDIVTMGQYLQPNQKKLRVKAFIDPSQFKKYEEYGHQIGIKHMYCGPFVRSSYNAHHVLEKSIRKS